MSRVKIKVGDNFLDTFNNIDDIFYITKQLYDIRNLEQRKADFSRSLELPATGNNLSALNIESNIPTQNRAIDSIILIDGASMILGKIIVTEYSSNSISIAILSGNFDLFDSIPNDSIKSLNFSAYDIPWNEASLAANASNTEGLNISIVDFFKDDTLDNGVGVPLEIRHNAYIDISNYGFVFFLRTIAKEIISNAGYTLEETKMTGDKIYDYSVVACPVNVPAITSVINARVNSLAAYIWDGGIEIGASVILPFDNVVSDPTGLWDNTNKYYVIGTADNYKIDFNYSLTYTQNTAGQLTIRLMKNGSQINARVYGVGGSYNGILSFTSQCLANDQLWVEIQAGYQNPATYDTVSVTASSFFEINQNIDDPTGNLVVSDWLPDINQRDFLTSWLSMFNATINSNPFSKTSEVYKWDDMIINAPQDLSAGMTSQTLANKISINSYFRESLMTFNNDDITRSDAEYTVSFQGDDSLPLYGTILTINAFSGSDESTIFGFGGMEAQAFSFSYRAATGFSILSGSASFTFPNDEDFAPGDYIRFGNRLDRILTAASKTSGTLYNTYHANSSGDCEIVRITRNSERARIGVIDTDFVAANYSLTTNGYNQYIGSTTITTRWVSFLNNMVALHDGYYKSMFNALQTPGVYSVWMAFTFIDFYNIDFSRPVYIKFLNGLFYINKIEQYKLNELCRVELIRINDIRPSTF